MGLKGQNETKPEAKAKTDKIRPKWDWKSYPVRLFMWRWSSIKSDQNGIERSTRACMAGYWKQIKSDQNGIESNCFNSLFLTAAKDKIRPKWDWKRKSAIMFPTKSRKIKSDQNGIERCINECFYLFNKVLIKSDQNGIESECFCIIASTEKNR